MALVKVPLEGVPKAPPLTTGAPAEPTFTASAVATPVPKPDTPVEIGSPVALVSVPDVGVPKAPPDVRSVADVGIVVELIVKPLTFVTVAPDAIDVEPKVGAV